MTLKLSFGVALASLAATSTAFAQVNDDCSGAIALTQGTGIIYDTTTSTQSLPAWTCASTTAPDQWYSFTPSTAGDYSIETCGSSYDTALEVFDGTCAALNLIECNDDACGTSSQVVLLGATAGTTYLIRVGGWDVEFGTGTILADTYVPPVPPPANCIETTYQNNNQGNPGGAVYFDVTVTGPGSVNVTGLEANYNIIAGTTVGMEMWTTPGTSLGNEGNPAVWTMVAVDDALALSAGTGMPTAITFTSPATLPPGTTGVALIAIGASHAYTNGTGTNQQELSMNGQIQVDLGGASNFPFAAPLFSPRVWNGRLCDGMVATVGTPFCNPNDPNSTGMSTNLIASFGSGTGSDLHLDSNQGPNGQFGYFLVGTASSEPGIMLPNSQGRLCLAIGGGNSLGRYNVTGTQFNSLGLFNAAGELQNLASTSGSGAGYDVPTTVPIAGSPQIMVGQTWHFQLWHRENGGLSNFSNGLSISF